MERVVLFAKAPRRGEVKTRLVPPLTHDQAMSLHRAMLVDQMSFVASLVRAGRTAELSLDGAWPGDAAFPALPKHVTRTIQSGGDLGSRIERALVRGHASGSARIAIIGADAPTLPASIVEDAFARLRSGAGAVVTPSPDGGYVLIATTGAHPALFRQIPWGTEGVLAVTRRRAADAGVGLEETAPWADVDRPADLRRLIAETLADPERAPATAAVVASLRLVIPEARVV